MEETTSGEEQSKETALIPKTQEEQALVLHEEQEPPPEKKVTGFASLWLLVSTIFFTLGIYIPFSLLVGCVGLFLLLSMNTYLFFDGTNGWTAASAPISIILGIGGVITISMLVGIGRALAYSEEEKIETPVRGLILTVLTIVLAPLTFLLWFIDIESSTSATIAVAVIIANMFTITIGYIWRGSQLTWRRLVDGLRDMYQRPFAAGVWSCFSTLSSFAAAAGFIILYHMVPNPAGMTEDQNPSWFEEFIPDEERSSLGAFSARAPSETTALEECFTTLLTKPAPTWSYRDMGIKRVSDGTSLDTYSAEDVVHKTMYSVCVSHQKERKRNLPMYFNKSLGNNISDVRRGWSRRCEINTWIDDSRVDNGREDFRRIEDINLIKQLLCTLSAKDQNILELYAEGHTDREIGMQLEMKKNSVTQRRRRALQKLREEHERRF